MTWINDYPEHACVLAKFSADSILLNSTEVWLDAPPQPQHNKNKMQLIVVWNKENKPLMNPTHLGSTNQFKQTIPEAIIFLMFPSHQLLTPSTTCSG